MQARKFQCTNLANCDKALSKELLEIAEGEEAVCPECKQKLAEVKPKSAGGGLKWVVAGVGALLAVCVVIFLLWPSSPNPEQADAMLTEFFPNLPAR